MPFSLAYFNLYHFAVINHTVNIIASLFPVNLSSES